MSIHTIGDSHSCNGWNGIIHHHLGPVLCYSLGKKNYIDAIFAGLILKMATPLSFV